MKPFFLQNCAYSPDQKLTLIHMVQGGGTVITEGGGIDHTSEMTDDMMVTFY
jgi:hypothetical protein